MTEAQVSFGSRAPRSARPKNEELNSLVINAVKEILKSNKRVKARAKHNSGAEEDNDNLNFENLNIGEL